MAERDASGVALRGRRSPPHECSLTLLWQKDGSGVAYEEGNDWGQLIEEPDGVLRHRLSYDRLRDLALSPSDSLTFVRDVLEEHRS